MELTGMQHVVQNCSKSLTSRLHLFFPNPLASLYLPSAIPDSLVALWLSQYLAFIHARTRTCEGICVAECSNVLHA